MKQKQQKNKSVLSPILTVIGVFLCVIFGLMLIFNITIIIKGAMNSNEPPTVLGKIPLVVLSGSMSGNKDGHIEVGDLIIVDKVDTDELEVGDVIAFWQHESITTHRIIEISKDENGDTQFITKGDANNIEDQEPIKEDKVIGILENRIPELGNIILFFREPLGTALCIGVPAVILLVYYTIRQKKYVKDNNSEIDKMRKELEELKNKSDK